MTHPMANEMENIDRYVSGHMSAEERQAFERRIVEDPDLANEVAFHLSALAAARDSADESRKARFRTIYEEENGQQNGRATGKVMALSGFRRALTAAAILLVVGLAWVFFLRPASPHILAQEYIKKELTRTGVNMGNDQDVLTPARTMFNAGDLTGTAKYLDSLLHKEPDNADANRFSGVVSLRQGDHDKALGRFRRLAALPGLYANPGQFLEAVTLLDRDASGDREKAREALMKVMKDGLGGKEWADKWLKKF